MPPVPCARESNWFESPSTPLDVGNDFSSSTGDGLPCLASSSAPMTSTGAAASSGVPRISEPVMMMSGSVFATGS